MVYTRSAQYAVSVLEQSGVRLSPLTAAAAADCFVAIGSGASSRYRSIAAPYDCKEVQYTCLKLERILKILSRRNESTATKLPLISVLHTSAISVGIPFLTPFYVRLKAAE